MSVQKILKTLRTRTKKMNKQLAEEGLPQFDVATLGGSFLQTICPPPAWRAEATRKRFRKESDIDIAFYFPKSTPKEAKHRLYKRLDALTPHRIQGHQIHSFIFAENHPTAFVYEKAYYRRQGTGQNRNICKR